MDEIIYEVSRDEYVGFIGQINPKCIHYQDTETDTYNIREIFSNKTNQLLCKQCVPHSDQNVEVFYVYTMPDDDERQPPKVVRKITLNEREDVQAFFDILNKIQKDKKND